MFSALLSRLAFGSEMLPTTFGGAGDDLKDEGSLELLRVG
jgi:hypothetical protein